MYELEESIPCFDEGSADYAGVGMGKRHGRMGLGK